jgi:hypothetical protein
VIETMRDLGSLLLTAGRPEEAKPMLEAAAVRVRESLPDEALLVGTTLTSYGRCLMAMERTGDAEAALLGAYRALDEAGLADGAAGRATAGQLAELYRSAGRNAEAEEWRRRHGG